MDIRVGDVLVMKKAHPCGNKDFLVTRSGMDFKLECKKCGHRYVPTFKAVNLAMHMGRTRYLKCPECGKKSWQKKVISKE